jgi:uncharacterized membrane protein (DUF2068 family)
MNRLSRASALKIAAVLSFLLGLFSFVTAIPYLARGAAALDTANNAPPFFIILAALVFAILRIVGAYGLWQNQRWGVMLTIVANALDAVAAAPGVLFAPTRTLWISALVSVVVSVVVIVLCLWRDRRPAVA